MFKSLALNKKVIGIKSLITFAAVAASVALPQLFHWLGIASGAGASLGATFLPMHLPVLLSGLIAGPAAGLIAGAASPVLSFGISGMPAAVMLPFMTIELGVYGLSAGLLRKTKMPVIVKLLIAQVAGRALRAVAIIIAVYGFNAQGIAIQAAWNIILTGLPGIVLQWALIPLLLFRFKDLIKRYE